MSDDLSDSLERLHRNQARSRKPAPGNQTQDTEQILFSMGPSVDTGKPGHLLITIEDQELFCQVDDELKIYDLCIELSWNPADKNFRRTIRIPDHKVSEIPSDIRQRLQALHAQKSIVMVRLHECKTPVRFRGGK